MKHGAFSAFEFVYTIFTNSQVVVCTVQAPNEERRAHWQASNVLNARIVFKMKSGILGQMRFSHWIAAAVCLLGSIARPSHFSFRFEANR